MTVPNNANTYLPGVVQIPSSLVITNITRSYPAIVTITVESANESNTYREGQVVRMTVPIPYKMFQMNGLTAKILSVDNNNITIDVNSINFDPFSVPSSPVGQPASLAPSGSRNLQFDNNTNQVGFQSLNNIGN